MARQDYTSIDPKQLPSLVRQLLAGRGFVTDDQIQEFLQPDYATSLHSPWLMTDMDKAADRIVQAIEQQQSVAIYGDYDIDGITATAVMVTAFELWGLKVQAYIPNRFEEGYGINEQALTNLRAAGAELVISVDCGITSVNEALWARQHGLDLVITDHHTPPPELPQAVAVVNPKRSGDTYPYRELAGVGVAFKVVQAVSERLGRPAEGQLKWLLDLVALGTVCDVVPLNGENRTLVFYGLRVLRQTRRVGLRALAQVAGIDISGIRSTHLGFGLGPRLNASGRLEHAALSLELVLTGDTARATAIAATLDDLNRQRQSDQARIVKEALTQAEIFESSPVLVLADKAWSHGIVGIAASKVVEQAGKPTLVAQVLGDIIKGSARSVAGFNIIEALRAQPELFVKFGGHAYAAGFTIQSEKLNDLRQHLENYWREHAVDQETGREDGEIIVSDMSVIDQELVAALQMLEPFGNGNPEPLFELQGVRARSLTTMGASGQHVRGMVVDQSAQKLPLVAFGWTGRLDELAEATTLIGTLNQNEWRGVMTIQLMARRAYK